MNKQRGGTLLGFILGALVGLGAALAVAVYITKVPIPFMNKSQPRGVDGDAAEAKKNRDWDPNSGLSGKTPAPAAIPSGPSAPPVVAAPAPVVTPQAPAAKSADPLGDLASSKARFEAATKSAAVPAPQALPAPVSPSADPFTYFVQVGAFRTPEDAEQQRARISLLGLQAKVSEREQSGRTVYRVRLGPFEKKEEADKAKERLDGNGVETALVRVQK
ncbi:MAG: SPOR domain-containing protein [Pseudomonadota bacterium]